ncbi:MAG: aminotransferase class I/II-fold pyridoxal phosphate-dependent enzyme [Candidatus Caenarcaniphilales bacterium]|nr:aminotransferase class I/II-fold pyridoxal phosphate-dependent enzyme [Candidatus Caenarcaniphilales bacterium]
MYSSRNSAFVKKLNDIASSKSIRTHTPIHAGSNLFLPRSFNNLFKYDLSELNGLDDLHNPEGLIKKIQEDSAELFQVEETYLSVNGASGCLMAACLALGEGGKVLVPMNAHKSVLSGLILSGADPIWYEPEWDKEWGVYRDIDINKIEDLIRSNKDIKGCFVTSQTYEGIQCKLDRLVEVCHENNIPVIADESHGAHLSLLGNGVGAINSCADLIIHSGHKSLGSLTQTGLMHFQSELMNSKKVAACMSLLQTTSPSYLLLASLIETLSHLKRSLNPLIKQALTSQNLRAQLRQIEGIDFLENNDPSRLVISLKDWGGEELSNWLYDNYKIETELHGNKWILLLVGFDVKSHRLRQLKRIFKIAVALKKTKKEKEESIIAQFAEKKSFKSVLNPRRGFFLSDNPKIRFKCPPGIPVDFPGYKEFIPPIAQPSKAASSTVNNNQVKKEDYFEEVYEDDIYEELDEVPYTPSSGGEKFVDSYK